MFRVKIFSTICFMWLVGLAAFGQNRKSVQPVLLVAADGTETSINFTRTVDQSAFLDNAKALGQDDVLIKIPGQKNKLRRSEILSMADEVVRAKGLADGDSATADRYLYCVSKAIKAERYQKESIFTPTNIIATYTKLSATPYPSAGGNIRFGISRLCDRLDDYFKKMIEVLKSTTNTKKGDAKNLSARVWDDVLLSNYRVSHPDKDPQQLLTADRKAFCLFGPSCTIDASSVGADGVTNGGPNTGGHR